MSGPALVVIPTYNELDNLPGLTAAVLHAMPDADLLVVDDASPDGTGALADALARREPHIKVLHRSAKLGLGTAYREGFTAAINWGYEQVFQMDADFSHEPADLLRLRAALESGADLAIGSRWVAGGGTRNWGLRRRMLSRGGSFYARTILGVPIRDLTGGFKGWRRTALEAIALGTIRSEGYSFQIEMTYRAIQRQLRVVEVPIVFTDRRVGQSKMSGAIFREALFAVWRLRFRR